MASSVVRPIPKVIYPEDDGLPMSENTLQFEWIVNIKNGLEWVFRDNPMVFIAGDLLWYPVEGDNTTRQAPDIMVVLGRPKGHRGSYRPWEEDDIAPQVVFEILSPGNRYGEMVRKFQFYEKFGVEEYYVYNPENQVLTGYQRQGHELRENARMDGWISPRLKIRFDLSKGELQLLAPDGIPLATYLELANQSDLERKAREQAQERAEKLAAQLRALGVEPEA